MNNKKSLKDLSWICPEDEYRNNEAISYSNISFYAREGFRRLPYMREKIDAQHFRYGSLVDCLISEKELLDDKFYISDTDRPSDAISRMIEEVYLVCGDKYQSLSDVPQEVLISALDKEKYYLNYGKCKRLEYLYKYGTEYFKLLNESNGKHIVSKTDFNYATTNAYTLKSHKYTAKYFNQNPFDENTERFYQLKFKIKYKDKFLKCMMDLVIVDHANKVIIPCDLKTTGHNENEFDESFKKWMYYIQGQLYSHILNTIISKDEYFKNFKISSYRFIVINKFNNNPVVWIFPHNMHEGDFIDEYGNIIKGWESLYNEMIYYLDSHQFKYSKESMENDGEMIIRNINPLKKIKGLEEEDRIVITE